MTPHRHWFRSYAPLQTPIRLADGKVIYSAGVGTVVFEPVISGRSQRAVEFTRVLHVPELANNLFSVLSLSKLHGFAVHIVGNTMSFIRDNAVLFTASINEQNTAYLDGTTQVHLAAGSAFGVSSPADLALWHRRTMHLHSGAIQRALRESLVTGVAIDKPNASGPPNAHCEPCLAGKMHASSFHSTGTITPHVLDLIHSDLVGPLPVRVWIPLFCGIP